MDSSRRRLLNQPIHFKIAHSTSSNFFKNLLSKEAIAIQGRLTVSQLIQLSPTPILCLNTVMDVTSSTVSIQILKFGTEHWPPYARFDYEMCFLWRRFRESHPGMETVPLSLSSSAIRMGCSGVPMSDWIRSIQANDNQKLIPKNDLPTWVVQSDHHL